MNGDGGQCPADWCSGVNHFTLCGYEWDLGFHCITNPDVAGPQYLVSLEANSDCIGTLNQTTASCGADTFVATFQGVRLSCSQGETVDQCTFDVVITGGRCSATTTTTSAPQFECRQVLTSTGGSCPPPGTRVCTYTTQVAQCGGGFTYTYTVVSGPYSNFLLCDAACFSQSGSGTTCDVTRMDLGTATNTGNISAVTLPSVLVHAGTVLRVAAMKVSTTAGGGFIGATFNGAAMLPGNEAPLPNSNKRWVGHFWLLVLVDTTADIVVNVGNIIGGAALTATEVVGLPIETLLAFGESSGEETTPQLNVDMLSTCSYAVVSVVMVDQTGGSWSSPFAQAQTVTITVSGHDYYLTDGFYTDPTEATGIVTVTLTGVSPNEWVAIYDTWG